MFFALLALPVSAAECPDGEHWVETVGEGHYEQGACIDSETTCVQSEWQCSHWGPLHILCWDWDKVCVQQKTTCNAYEQVWVEGEAGGYCEADEPIDEPIEEEEEEFFGGGGMLNYVPKVQNYATRVDIDGNEVTIGFLNSKFSYGGLLIKQKPVEFATNMFGRIFEGNSVEVITPDYLFGYEILVDDLNKYTYHTITTTLDPGTYYIRPFGWFQDMYVDYFLGQEIEVVVE